MREKTCTNHPAQMLAGNCMTNFSKILFGFILAALSVLSIGADAAKNENPAPDPFALIKASPEYQNDKATMDSCTENPSAACLYQIIFKNIIVGTRGSLDTYRMMKRPKLIEGMIGHLIAAKEFDVAEHYALRELARTDLASGTGPDSELYKLYKQAHARAAPAKNSATESTPIFERSQGEPERGRFDKGFYSPINEGKLKEAAEFLEGYKTPRYVDNGVIAIGIREYLDALYSLGIAYAKAGDWKNVEATTQKMLDNQYINDKLGLSRSNNALEKKADRTFEFLDAMVGHGAGTDFRVKLIWGMVNTSKTFLKGGKKEQARALIEKAQTATSGLEDPSLSLSEALIFLSEGQALVGNYDKAFANAEKVNEICCQPHPQSRQLMQDKRHYDNALGGIVTGAIASGNVDKAQEAADKIAGERLHAENLLEVSEALATEKKIEAARANIEQAIKIARNLKEPEEQAFIMRLASDKYLLLNNKENAAKTLDEATDNYFPRYRTMVAHGDVITSPDIMPLPDMINSYIKQGRAGEVLDKLSQIKGASSDQKSDFLYLAARASAKQGDESAVSQLLQQIAEVRKGITADAETFATKASANPNFKSDDIKKMKSQMISASARRQAISDVSDNLELAFAFAATKPDAAKKYYDLSQQAYQKILNQEKADPSNRENQNRFANDALYLTKKTMIEAKLSNQKQLSTDQLQAILLPIRATTGSDGYSFLRKMQVLLSISDIFRDFQFVPEADQLMSLARLMADRIFSTANRFGSRGQEQSAAYATLAEKFASLGKDADAADALTAVADLSSRIKTGGTERSVFLTQQRFLTEIINEGLKQKAPKNFSTYLQNVSLPLYRQVCLAAASRYTGEPAKGGTDNLNLAEALEDVWDDEELVYTIPPLLNLAESQRILQKKDAAEHTLSLVDSISKSLIGYRGAQANILIADFFEQQKQPERQAEALKQASVEAERSQFDQKKFQAMIAQRMANSGNSAPALSDMKAEAKKILETCKNLSFNCAQYAGGYGPDYDRAEELVPIAGAILDMEGGFTEAGRKVLISWLDNAPITHVSLNKDVQYIFPDCAFKGLPDNLQVQVIIGGRSDKATAIIKKSDTPILLVLSGSYSGVTWALKFDEGASLAGLLVGNHQKIEELKGASFPIINVNDREWGRKGCGSVVYKSSEASTVAQLDFLNSRVREFAGKDVDHINFEPNSEGVYEVSGLTSDQMKKKDEYKKLSQSVKKSQTAYERGQEVANILETWEKNPQSPMTRPVDNESSKLWEQWCSGARAHYQKFNEKYTLADVDSCGSASAGSGLRIVDGPAYLNENGSYLVLRNAPHPVTNKAQKLYYLDDYSYCERNCYVSEDGF